MRNHKKDKINILMNIDNYFGAHQGRLSPIILFLCVSAAPFIFYILFLSTIIPLKWAIIVEVLFVIRMALFIVGKENEKVKLYRQARDDEYASANDLVRVSHVHEDGLIEYMNGMAGYIISAFTATYFNDNTLSVDLEGFIAQLKDYEFDIHCHLVVDEFKLQDNLEAMGVYKDKEMLKERIGFYILQDQYCTDNSKLYRINFIVKSTKAEWKRLRANLEVIVSCTYSKVFKECYICDRKHVSDVMSRDVCAYIDLANMLKEKYRNENYYGSKVLFYGEEIPDKYKPEQEKVGIEERRVMEGSDNECK